MAVSHGLAPILMIEDSPEDVHLSSKALMRAKVDNPIVTVGHGYEAIEYLQGTGKYTNREEFPLPCFILLDLKMPRMNGLEFLSWVQKTPEFRRIPTIVFTTSAREEDIKAAYERGAHSFITKPLDFMELVKLIRAGHSYWTRVARSIR